MFEGGFPVLTDPFFYAVAVPAVLLMGISKSGFGAGFGALSVPLMALAVPVPQAASIMMPILLLIDVFGLVAYRRDLDWQLLRFLLPWGLVGIVVGYVGFRSLDGHLVEGLVGALTLLFLAQRLLARAQVDGVTPPRWWGALLTILSGFTSFVAHTGGPPINAYLLPMRLPPLRFASTLTVFFFVLNFSKWVPYGALGLLDGSNMSTALVLLPLAPMGVWLGVRWARRVSPQLFYRLVYLGMFLTGCKLVWDGFLAPLV